MLVREPENPGEGGRGGRGEEGAVGRPGSEEVNKRSATTDGGLCCWETAPSHFPLRIETLSPGLGGGQWGGEVGKVEGKQKDFRCR